MTAAVGNQIQNSFDVSLCEGSWAPVVTTVAAIAIGVFSYLSYAGIPLPFVASLNPFYAAALIIAAIVYAFFVMYNRGLEDPSLDLVVSMKKNFQLERGVNTKIVFEPLKIFEYVEVDAPHRDKKKVAFENAIVERIRSEYADSVSLLSLGRGGLLSEFITVEKLVHAGFKKITIDCMEEIDEREDFSLRLQKVNDYFKKIKEVAVEFRGIDRLQEGREYNAILGLDYKFSRKENPFKAAGLLVNAKQQLVEGGFLALSFDDEASFIGKELDPMPEFAVNSRILTMAADMANQLKREESLFVVLSFSKESIDNNRSVAFFFLALALGLEQAGHTYSKITVTWFRGLNYADLAYQICQSFPETCLVISADRDFDEKYDLLFTDSGDYSLLKEDGVAYIATGEEIFRQKGDTRLQLR